MVNECLIEKRERLLFFGFCNEVLEEVLQFADRLFAVFFLLRLFLSLACSLCSLFFGSTCSFLSLFLSALLFFGFLLLSLSLDDART